MGEKIEFVDTTIRDGKQSLWDATGLTTAKTLSFAPSLDAAGFRSIDFNTSGHIGVTIRYHKENPWDKIRLVCKAMPRTPLRYGGTFRRFFALLYEIYASIILSLCKIILSQFFAPLTSPEFI